MARNSIRMLPNMRRPEKTEQRQLPRPTTAGAANRFVAARERRARRQERNLRNAGKG